MRAPLTFIDPPTLASMLEKGHNAGPGQWMARCPCHADNTPSLSIRWGRNGGTVVKCHGRRMHAEGASGPFPQPRLHPQPGAAAEA